MLLGIGPVKEFPFNPSWCSRFMRVPIVCGIVPTRPRLFLMIKFSIEDRSAISCGIVPLRLAPSISVDNERTVLEDLPK